MRFPLRYRLSSTAAGSTGRSRPWARVRRLSKCLEVVKPEGRVNLYGIAPLSEPYLPEEEGDPRVFRGKVAEAEAHERLIEWVEQGVVNPGRLDQPPDALDRATSAALTWSPAKRPTRSS